MSALVKRVRDDSDGRRFRLGEINAALRALAAGEAASAVLEIQ